MQLECKLFLITVTYNYNHAIVRVARHYFILILTLGLIVMCVAIGIIVHNYYYGG